jgi:hypothetical protein
MKLTEIGIEGIGFIKMQIFEARFTSSMAIYPII